MRPINSDADTIAAIATPLGEGGLAVLRVSGRDALQIADQVFVSAGRPAVAPSAAPSHTVHYGHVQRGSRRIDEVLLTVLRAPRTFTREDTVELSCHGGVFVARQVLDALLAAGARLAGPGEFTRRAFLAGRIDLTQAEAVADIIHARTELALSAACEQLAGTLSRQLNHLRDNLMNTLAHLEAHIDFPDEDIAPDSRAGLQQRLDRGLIAIDELLSTAREGQVLRRGIRAAIVGRPNAGKSSLLNQLLGRDRAIVSPIPGTTRDTIEETANIRGLPVVFVDTAGLREAADALEAEGIRRTRLAVSRAQLVLHVLDHSEPLSEVDRTDLQAPLEVPRILVLNKSDLPRQLTLPSESPERREDANFPWSAVIPVSCVTGKGLDPLKDAIAHQVSAGWAGVGMHEVAINARHEDALRRARESVERATAGLHSFLPLELVAHDLRLGLHAIGEVVGKTATEDLLDAVFGQFCIGK